MKYYLVLLFVPGLYIACNQSAASDKQNDVDTAAVVKNNVIACPPGSKLNIAKIEQITGMKGVEKNGEYKIICSQE